MEDDYTPSSKSLLQTSCFQSTERKEKSVNLVILLSIRDSFIDSKDGLKKDVCNVIAYLPFGFGYKKLNQSVLILKILPAKGLKKKLQFEVLLVSRNMTTSFFIKGLY